MTTIALDTGLAGLGSILGITETVPWLFADGVIGTIATSALCALNLTDPGDFQMSMLSEPAIIGDLPNPAAAPGSLNRWIWDKTAYYFFQQGCVCIGTGQAPPPPVVITNPPGTDTRPTTPEGQDQLTRIENNQSVSAEGLNTLYLGVLGNNVLASNLSSYLLPNYAYAGGPGLGNMVGEGVVDLPGRFLSSSSSYVPDMAGVLTQIVTLPNVYKQRGTLHPRYYGIGSVMWIGEPAGGGETVTQRDSIHYQRQFIPMPRHATAYRLAWRMMPGAVVAVAQVNRQVDGAVYSSPGYNDEAFAPLTYVSPPHGFTDPPFQPRPAGRTYSLPPAAPP